jgi:putative flippase GtrA
VRNSERPPEPPYSSAGSGALVNIDRSPMVSVLRQFTTFAGVGAVATIAHYAVLIGLVEMARVSPVVAAACGFVAGGILSYRLNRRHTFRSERRHDEAVWRFAVVAGVGFVATCLLMALFVDLVGVPYLPAQAVTTVIVMLWGYAAHRTWTFG